jgi:TonB-linked SusC/RagA family outer membrane protein
MKTSLKGFTTLLLVFVVQSSFAQTKNISGTITDDSSSLPGVSILIKGTSVGVESDFDGNYTIEASVGDILQFSFVGMETIVKTIENSNIINVVLSRETESLSEVVVVAYGTRTRESIVGAVSVITNEVIEKQQIVSVVNALQGTVPGVHIIASGGQPGSNPSIYIRGVSSINATAEPLIILDGAPFNGNINTISSDQIESMTVLKDASSTSLYGARGANGVLLINTKKGRTNSPTSISFNSSLGFANQAVKNHTLVDTDTFTEFTWEAMRNSAQYDSGLSPNSAAQSATDNLVQRLGYNPYGNTLPVAVDGKLVSTDKSWETDWPDELFNDAAMRTEHTLAVSGGSENTSYYFSANYLDQEGSIKTSDFERVTTRMNIDSKVTDWLNVGLNSSYSTSSQTTPNQSGSEFTSTIQWINSIASLYPVYRHDAQGTLIVDAGGNKIYDYGNNADGQPVNARRTFEGENIVGSLYLYDALTKQDNVTLNSYAQIKITKDLSFKTQLSYEKYTFDAYNYLNNEYGKAASIAGSVEQNRNFITTKNIINSFNYNKSFDKHTINANAIHEAYERNNDDMGAAGIGFLPNVKVLDGSTSPESVSGSFTDETLESYLARVAYDYNRTYFVEGSFRTDGSSRFNDEVRWGNFYSVGGSWIISRENFLENIQFFDYLKLRFSYGELGNNRGIGYFPYLSLYETGWNELDNTGVILGDVADPILTWEKTKSTNIGLDFKVYKSIFSGSVDYYSKESLDLIYDKPLAPSTGNETIKTNIGALKNYGVEVALNANIRSTDKIRWTSSLNFSMDNNEVTELTQESIIKGTKRWEVGKSLYEFYIWEWAGVNPSNGYGMWFKDVLDSNGEPTGEQETTSIFSEASRNYVGKSSMPDFIGGFNNSLSFGNFDFNILFNFSMGAYIYDYSYAGLMEGFQTAGSPASVDSIDRWQQPGDITDTPLFLASQNDFSTVSDRFLFKNDYVRLKALTFGYSIPSQMISKYGISKLRFYFQGDNLVTFQSHDGIDPEQSIYGTTNSRSYNQRITSFGINLEF